MTRNVIYEALLNLMLISGESLVRGESTESKSNALSALRCVKKTGTLLGVSVLCMPANAATSAWVHSQRHPTHQAGRYHHRVPACWTATRADRAARHKSCLSANTL